MTGNKLRESYSGQKSAWPYVSSADLHVVELGCEGWLFPNERGKLPMDFNNLFRRNIMGRLQEAGLDWHGWHAFRRGLASNLSELGVPDHVIQKILRHGDLSTTQRAYRKTRPKEVRKAMKKLSKRVGKATHELRRTTRVTRDKQGTRSRGSL